MRARIRDTELFFNICGSTLIVRGGRGKIISHVRNPDESLMSNAHGASDNGRDCQAAERSRSCRSAIRSISVIHRAEVSSAT
jgi:hypothetical protein